MLSGTTTVNAVNGVATFSTLTHRQGRPRLPAAGHQPGRRARRPRAPSTRSTPATRCTGTGTCSTTASTHDEHAQRDRPGRGHHGAERVLRRRHAARMPGLHGAGRELVLVPVHHDRDRQARDLPVRPSTRRHGDRRRDAVLPRRPVRVREPRRRPGRPGRAARRHAAGSSPCCPTARTGSSGPCIASRSTTPDSSSPTGYDVVLTIQFPAGLPGDPWGRACSCPGAQTAPGGRPTAAARGALERARCRRRQLRHAQAAEDLLALAAAGPHAGHPSASSASMRRRGVVVGALHAGRREGLLELLAGRRAPAQARQRDAADPPQGGRVGRGLVQARRG